VIGVIRRGHSALRLDWLSLEQLAHQFTLLEVFIFFNYLHFCK
jgi:hypothetical protein